MMTMKRVNTKRATSALSTIQCDAKKKNFDTFFVF